MSTTSKKPSAKTVFIIRGLPGSGKTYLASLIAKEFSTSAGNTVRICSVDHYFLQEDGAYKFDKRLVGRAHAECLANFLDGLNKGYENVILDNTNSQRWEYLNYESIAKAFGYQLKVLEIECHSQSIATLFHQRNTHNVPESAHLNMFQRWEPDSRSVSIRPWFPEHVSLMTAPPRRSTSSHYGGYGGQNKYHRQSYHSSQSYSADRRHPSDGSVNLMMSRKAPGYHGFSAPAPTSTSVSTSTSTVSSSTVYRDEGDWPSYS